jgi:CBS domain-containing protein
MGTLNPEIRIAFRDLLREARAQAINDSEAFVELLFVFEKLGSFLKGKIGALGDYEGKIINLANESSLGKNIPKQYREFHSSAAILFNLVRDARNDALHQGAFARHLTTHAIELSVILEDALTNMATNVSDFMVRNPVCAEMWQPLSFIRQQMLANSFSYLPVKNNGDWELVEDKDIVLFLRKPNTDRNAQLAMTLEDACANGLTLSSKPPIVPANENIMSVLGNLNGRPLLVHRQSDPSELVGIITSFDLL